MNTKNMLYSTIALVLITITLFSASEWYTQKDKQFFQDHKDELTRIDRITYQDGTGENYYYDSTPYTTIAKSFFYAYLLIPALICIVASANVISTTKKLIHTILIPLIFTLLTFLLQSKNIYLAVGWEKPFGITLIALYCGTVILLSIMAGFIVKKINKTKKINSK